ncbi:hypothetical protein K2173_000695 [Erythroxylum novogranatense]|uniref:Diacylglycerol O-acyltransferase n=1 Tax=Erythroxylum novogranatense TaxID=1862640 RepID=A0AAV8SIY4_9ROSI|nr:hypothetical protein K2173_000695 [Erythroxylum novogranatense]
MNPEEASTSQEQGVAIGLEHQTDYDMAINGEKEALSPAARLFHAPNFNCYIIAIIGCKTHIDPAVIKAGLRQTLMKHPRFSSKVVVDDQGKRKRIYWKRTIVNLDDHVIVPNLDPNMDSPDQFVEDYNAHLTTMSMDISKPLWEIHILNVKTVDAEAVGVFKIHHSMGDGVSLMSLLLACTRKTNNPSTLPSVPVQKRVGSRTSGSNGFWWIFKVIWTATIIIFNTLIDMIMFIATMLFLKDIKNPIKGASGVEQKPKRFVHRMISMDDIKLLKNAMNTTVNDVILGVTQAGLSRYLHRKYGENGNGDDLTHGKSSLPKNVRLRAAILVNIRPTAGIQELAELMGEANDKKAKWGWGNWIGYILLPFNVSLQDDPLDYIRTAKANIDRKKLSFEAILTNICGRFILYLLGIKTTAYLVHRVLSNTSLAFSNVVGPLEEISFYGHPIEYLAPSVYGHPQALTIHFQSYCEKMIIVLAVDPEVIPDAHILLDDLQDSLGIIRNAIVHSKLDTMA